MPTFQGLVNEEGVMSLIEYVKSLQASGAAAQRASTAPAADRGAGKQVTHDTTLAASPRQLSQPSAHRGARGS